MKKLDDIDIKILNILQRNGRITTRELSKELNLSATPTFERVKKLEKAGIIDHYAAVINADKMGKKLYAFAHVSLKDHSKELVDVFTKQIMDTPQVQECHYVTGDSDFILKILLDDMEKYREFMMNQLFDMSNIAKIESFLSLSVLKKNNFVVVDND